MNTVAEWQAAIDEICACVHMAWQQGKELLAAWMAGIAYARATGGMILDGEESKFHTPDQGRGIVHNLEHPSPATLAALEDIGRRLNEKS